ncbi:MAG: hypothetical protein ACRCXT_12065 [Paraclostridium sp.]
MNWEYVSVDTDTLEPGKFYLVLTNKDNATLTLEKPLSGDILFSTDLFNEHFIIEDNVLKIKEYDTLVKRNSFDTSQFTIGIDGVIHLKNGTGNPADGVTINFSPVITNTQNCDEGSNTSTNPQLRVATIDGDTIVPLTNVEVDTIEVHYKLKREGYIETGYYTIINSTTIKGHTNRTTNNTLVDITFLPIKSEGGISVKITPSDGNIYQLTYKVTTL